eukprot:scaffold31418_cov16-Tisochrysis_lutea.AAC.2
MSAEVVDSNPYSRLMALQRMGVVKGRGVGAVHFHFPKSRRVHTADSPDVCTCTHGHSPKSEACWTLIAPRRDNKGLWQCAPTSNNCSSYL